MNPRDRFRSVLEGNTPDRTPMVCRLDGWYQSRQLEGHWPQGIEGKSLEQIQLELGMGLSARQGKVFEVFYGDPVQHKHWREGLKLFDTWQVPAGTLSMIRQYQPNDQAKGIAPRIIEHPIRSLDAYAVFEQIISRRVYKPCFDEYNNYDQKIGSDGFAMVILGPIPVHEILQFWVGYENAFFHVADDPGVFDHAVAVANQSAKRMWPIVAESPCELVMHGVNFDSMMTSPPIFEKYFLPYLRPFNQLMHESGKQVAFHGDGDMSMLLDYVLEAGFDVADCLSTRPIVNCTLRQIHDCWQDKIVIWGGIPSNMLEPTYPQHLFEEHVQELLDAIAAGNRLIVGIADQMLASSSYERVQMFSDKVRNLTPNPYTS